jgi:hypothetical protein
MPADNKYGQNGYLGPSSDEPGKRTTSGLLPELAAEREVLRKDPRDDFQNWQTREVSANAYANAYGHRPRSYYDIGKPVRAVKQAAGPDFDRGK